MIQIKHKHNQYGFTLIEVIVVLVLMGILAVGFSVGLVKGIEHYVFAQEASHLSQKAQLAMARIKKELTDVKTITYISSTRIDYSRHYSPPSCLQDDCTYRIQKSGDQILLEGIGPAFSSQVLIDRVDSAGASGSGNIFSFVNFSGAGWSLETDGKVDNLSQIIVSFSVGYGANQSMDFNMTINPRQGAKLNIPKLN